jgi:hypothetical protein
MSHPSRTFDEINVPETIRRLNVCLDRGQVKQKDMVDATSIEKSKLSRWLSGHSSWSSIQEENYVKILDFIADRRLFVHASYEWPQEAALADMAFHSLARFLGLDAGAIDRAHDNLVGHYLGWRHSYFAPPHILKGAMDIVYDEQTRALRTFEHYRLPAGAMGEKSEEINFKRIGYIWPTRRNMYVMISQKSDHQDLQIAFLNKSFFNAMTLEKGSMHTIEGIVLDWQGPEFYMTKLFLQKLAKPLPAAEISLKTKEEVPSPVLLKLQERFKGPNPFLRAYK